MKKFIVAGILILLCLPVWASAGALPITVQEIADSFVYNDAFDALIFDFTLISPDADTLNAFTLTNAGYYQNIGFKNMCLYQDAGRSGFQGWGEDKALGCGAWDGANNYWYWDNLTVPLNSAGARLFAASDTDQLSTVAKYFQIGVPALKDANGDGKFALGDAGFFTASKNNGPESFVGNAGMKYLKYFYGDMLAPKAIFSNLTEGQEIESGSYLISGEAKDSGPIGLAWVRLVIDGVTHSVETSDNYARWTYNWRNIALGSHILKIQASDNNNNLFESAVVSVAAKAKAPVVETPAATATTNASVDYTSGRWVKTAAGSSVYFLDSGNVRHAYPVLAVWQSYFGDDFSRVQTIGADAMATYSLGKNVPFKTGALIKIPSAPKVYKVESGTIRWITTEAAAKSLFGDSWASTVKTLPESLFGDYSAGNDIQ